MRGTLDVKGLIPIQSHGISHTEKVTRYEIPRFQPRYSHNKDIIKTVHTKISNIKSFMVQLSVFSNL